MSIHYCMCSCRLMPGQCNYSPEIGISKEAYCVSLYPEWTNSFHLSIIGWYHGQMGSATTQMWKLLKMERKLGVLLFDFLVFLSHMPLCLYPPLHKLLAANILSSEKKQFWKYVKNWRTFTFFSFHENAGKLCYCLHLRINLIGRHSLRAESLRSVFSIFNKQSLNSQ